VTEEKNDDEISSAVGNYVNYLRLGSLVLLPTYGCHDDEKATATLERVLPKGSAIIPIRSSKLANEGGVLNCVSWTVEI
jgi:agmatine deiminase